MSALNSQISYFGADGRPTPAMQKQIEVMNRTAAQIAADLAALTTVVAGISADLAALTTVVGGHTTELSDLTARIGDLEAQMAGIAAVVTPTGGATIDAESRTAITAIIGAAA